MKKEFDVAIINYNGEKIIKKCLESVYQSNILPKKIIIFDNNSKDKSVNIIKKSFPKVELIESKKNIGFGRGNNECMKRSKSNYILFMNNDILLNKNCTKELLRGFSDNFTAIINPVIYKGWNKKNNSSIYSFGAEMNQSGFGYSLYDSSPNRDDLNCFSGACFMARSSIIKKIKFEKKFFMYYEEPDISSRILIDNYKIGRINTAKCYHLENYSSPKKKTDGICFRQYNAIQNRWYMLGKFWPTSLLLKAMPLNLFHLIYNIIFFLRHGKIKECKILYLSFLKLFEGRKKYIYKNDLWTGKLSRNNIQKIFSLQKRVYK